MDYRKSGPAAAARISLGVVGRLLAMPIHRLIYRSTARQELSTPQLQQLLLESRAFNRHHHITGVLLYANQQFMQVLEGERLVIQALYHRIRHDARHTEVLTLLDEPTTQRLFPNWSMGWCCLPPADFSWLQGYFDPRLRDPLLPQGYDASQVVLDLLEEFMEGQMVSF
jgi:hypothetical protein